MVRQVFKRILWVALAGSVVGIVAGVFALRDWDAGVVDQFRSHRWNFPSRVYADAPLVYPGMRLEGSGLFESLKRLDYRRVETAIERKGDYRFEAGSGTLEIFVRDFDHPFSAAAGHLVRVQIRGGEIARIVEIDNGEELYALELDPELISGLYQGSWEDRRVMTLEEAPPLLIRALVDVEDQRFYEHHGIDLQGVARALWVNYQSGHVVQGGSTLTQQLMKNMFLTDERSYKRKLREIAMALVVEWRFSKREILQKYINEIYLGQRGAQGVHGFWRASRFYFAKEPTELSVGEMAMLAGLVRGPSLYSPFRDPQRARRRRDEVLRAMLAAGDLDGSQYDTAVAEPIRLAPQTIPAIEAPYFVDFVRHELGHNYPADVLSREGLEVFTSIDTRLQDIAEDAVRDGLADLEKHHRRLRAASPDARLQACLIVIQPQTGAIKAMVGGRDYGSSQFNRCTQALRQPGSVFKPFTYLAAFEKARGSRRPLGPASRLVDAPFRWRFGTHTWAPSNSGNRYHGAVSARKALEHSFNAATARLARDTGLPAIIETARRLGVRSPLPNLPSVVLGSAEVTPLEIAEAYTALANGGLHAAPISVRGVFDRGGRPVERNPVTLEQVVRADTAYLVTNMLEGVLTRGTARAARKAGFTRPAAGKTGTTNDYRDAWFAGFTPHLLAVVWVGFDERRELELTGGDAALPIWLRFMKKASEDLPETPFSVPPGIASVKVDPLSGGRATAFCPSSVSEVFYVGGAPRYSCALHQEAPVAEGDELETPLGGQLPTNPDAPGGNPATDGAAR